MTVQDMIDALEKVEDKEVEVFVGEGLRQIDEVSYLINLTHEYACVQLTVED